MNELISLAIYVGKLEARIEALENAKRARSTEVEDDLTLPEEHQEEKDEALETEREIMEGMENIFSYDWPPKKKEDGEE